MKKELLLLLIFGSSGIAFSSNSSSIIPNDRVFCGACMMESPYENTATMQFYAKRRVWIQPTTNTGISHTVVIELLNHDQTDTTPLSIVLTALGYSFQLTQYGYIEEYSEVAEYMVMKQPPIEWSFRVTAVPVSYPGRYIKTNAYTSDTLYY